MEPAQPTPSQSQQDDLQFEQADYQQPVGGPPACVACQRPIAGSYFAAGDKVVCPACRDAYVASLAGGSGFGRLMVAAGAGLGAAFVGAAIYYAIAAATGYEIGLVAILVGFMVGFAVRWGSQGRGGWAYQLLAIVLTYGAIAVAYVPLEVWSASFQQTFGTIDPADASSSGEEESMIPFPALLVLAFALPFLLGAKNIMGLVIIAIGLWEAWKINKRAHVELTGPYQLAPAAAAPPTPPLTQGS